MVNKNYENLIVKLNSEENKQTYKKFFEIPFMLEMWGYKQNDFPCLLLHFRPYKYGDNKEVLCKDSKIKQFTGSIFENISLFELTRQYGDLKYIGCRTSAEGFDHIIMFDNKIWLSESKYVKDSFSSALSNAISDISNPFSAEKNAEKIRIANTYAEQHSSPDTLHELSRDEMKKIIDEHYENSYRNIEFDVFEENRKLDDTQIETFYSILKYSRNWNEAPYIFINIGSAQKKENLRSFRILDDKNKLEIKNNDNWCSPREYIDLHVNKTNKIKEIGFSMISININDDVYDHVLGVLNDEKK